MSIAADLPRDGATRVTNPLSQDAVMKPVGCLLNFGTRGNALRCALFATPVGGVVAFAVAYAVVSRSFGYQIRLAQAVGDHRSQMTSIQLTAYTS